MTTVFELMKSSGLSTGMAVISKAGHDTGRVYLVMRIEDRFAWLSDGDIRPAGKYKRKRIRHLKALGPAADAEEIRTILAEKTSRQADIRVRQLLREFMQPKTKGV